MIIIDNFFLEMSNIDFNPLRFGSFAGFMILLGYFVFGLPMFFLFYYILRKRSRDVHLRYQSNEQLRSYQITTISLSLTLTSSLAFLASLIHFMLSLFVFEESLQTIYWPFQLHSLISFCFFLLFTPNSFLWFRYRKKHKIRGLDNIVATKEEVWVLSIIIFPLSVLILEKF